MRKQNRDDSDKKLTNASENHLPENINPADNTKEWSGKWSISNVNSTAATSIAQQSNATLENRFDTVIITKVSKKRVKDKSGSIDNPNHNPAK